MKIRRLFYDIETSPNIALIWRPGYNISVDHENIIQERAIICIAYKWSDEKKVHHLTWDKKQNDKDMLLKFVPILESAMECVAHNGLGYDLKWIRTRCLIHGIPISPKIKHIDTLRIAKSLFAFNSNRLDYIAKFLGEDGKIKTSFSMWKNILLSNNQKELKKMVDYCKKDVVELEKVFNQLNTYISPATHIATLNGGEDWECPECGSSKSSLEKTRTTATGVIQRQMKCKDCHKYFTISDRAFHRKQNYAQDS